MGRSILFDAEGNLVSDEATDDPPPPMEQLLQILGEALITRAGDLWDALVAMPDTDPAYPAVEIVTDAVLTAALPLVDP